jgi:hypothetical protein
MQADKLIELSREIRHETDRANALTACLKYLPSAKTPEIAQEAIQSAFHFAAVSYPSAECLEGLVPCLPKESVPAVIDAALQIPVKYFSDTTEDYCALALAAIVPSLDNELRHQVLSAALSFKKPDVRTWLLCQLVPFLSKEERTAVFEKGIGAALAILDDSDIYDTLPKVAPHLSLTDLPATVNRASAITDSYSRAKAFLDLFDGFLQERDVLSKALEAAREVEQPSLRLQFLSEVAIRQPTEQSIETWREALTVASQLRYYTQEEVNCLCQPLPEALFAEALQWFSTYQDRRFLHRALDALGPRLDRELLNRAIIISRIIGDINSRVSALTMLLSFVSAEQHTARTQEVLAMANQIPKVEARIDALAALSHQLRTDEREAVCRKALEDLKEIRWDSVPVNALQALASAVPNELLGETIQFVRTFPASKERAQIVMTMARRLDCAEQLSLLRTELEEMQRLSSLYRWDALMVMLKEAPEELVLDIVKPAMETDVQTTDPYDTNGMAALLYKAVARLKEPERSQALQAAIRARAWQEYPHHWDDLGYVHWMCSLSPYLSHEWRTRTLDTARNLGMPEDRAEALLYVSDCFEEPEATTILDEAVDASRRVWDESSRAYLLSYAVKRLSPEECNSLLVPVQKHKDPYRRVAALTKLAFYLSEPEKSTALQVAFDNLPQLTETHKRIAALCRLAPLLSSSLVPEGRCVENGRILLVIQFPRDTATVTALHAQGLWAFNDSLCEALCWAF